MGLFKSVDTNLPGITLVPTNNASFSIAAAGSCIQMRISDTSQPIRFSSRSTCTGFSCEGKEYERNQLSNYVGARLHAIYETREKNEDGRGNLFRSCTFAAEG
ncbi:hypothetical protein DMN91_012709 [Ooceraea biroi]|uniref:Uncharacterized protein n=1 Tax=Ooceraea biroi TaxID=2015173 RepID=A0A3L8D2U5_OOCBI|nr:uncharacterized protein LOC105279996 [Ooceraea biroi]RLU14822.1 hypothetical protein DMN91_012709 [Ooceraea biroi]